MWLQTIASLLLVLLVASSAQAQNQSDVWRAFAQRLTPGSSVVVHLTDGRSVKGRLIDVTSDKVWVLPKTRLRVPARDVELANIRSIDARKEGASPGAKVLRGVGVAASILGGWGLLFAFSEG